MREMGEEQEYHDLLVFVGETVAGLSYDDEQEWIVEELSGIGDVLDE